MSTISTVSIGIEFKGSSEWSKRATITAINLRGLGSNISAVSAPSVECVLKEGPLRWVIPVKVVHQAPFQTERRLDKLSLSPEDARKIQLTARIFKEDLVGGRLRMYRQSDIPIEIAERSGLEAGESYLIRIQNIGDRCLKASFVKL